MSSSETISKVKSMEDLHFDPVEKEKIYTSLNFFSDFSALGNMRANMSSKCELKSASDPLTSKNVKDIIDTPIGTPTESATETATKIKTKNPTETPSETPSETPTETATKIESEPDPWSSIDQGTKTSPLVLIRRHILTNTNPDLKVVVGEFELDCYMTLWQAYSTYFNNNIDQYSSRIVFDEKDISANGVEFVYDWILSDHPLILPSALADLFQGACFLGIPELEKQCWGCLDNDISVREFHAFRMFMDDFRYFELNSFRELFFSRVCKYFLPLVASDAFLSLNFIEVCVLLSSNAIGVNTESEVLMAALRWIKHNPEREIVTEALMSCVRFELIEFKYLIQLVVSNVCPVADEVVRREKVRSRVVLSQNYAIEMALGLMTIQTLERLQEDNMQLQRQRQWIFDRKCSYHHKLFCVKRSNLTFAIFEQYLATLKKDSYGFWKDFQFISVDNRECRNNTCQQEIITISVKKDSNGHLRNYESTSEEERQFSNNRRVEENTVMVSQFLDKNHELCINYISFKFGKPILKVPDNVHHFIRNTNVKFRHLISDNNKNRKYLRILGFETIENEAFGTSKKLFDNIQIGQVNSNTDGSKSDTDFDILSVRSAPLFKSKPDVVDDKLQAASNSENPTSVPVREGVVDEHVYTQSADKSKKSKPKRLTGSKHKNSIQTKTPTNDKSVVEAFTRRVSAISEPVDAETKEKVCEPKSMNPSMPKQTKSVKKDRAVTKKKSVL